jgi:hypothetical protein
MRPVFIGQFAIRRGSASGENFSKKVFFPHDPNLSRWNQSAEAT